MLTMEKVVETGGDLQELGLPVLPSSSCPRAVPVWQARENQQRKEVLELSPAAPDKDWPQTLTAPQTLQGLGSSSRGGEASPHSVHLIVAGLATHLSIPGCLSEPLFPAFLQPPLLDVLSKLPAPHSLHVQSCLLPPPLGTCLSFRILKISMWSNYKAGRGQNMECPRGPSAAPLSRTVWPRVWGKCGA